MATYWKGNAAVVNDVRNELVSDWIARNVYHVAMIRDWTPTRNRPGSYVNKSVKTPPPCQKLSGI